MANVLTYIGQQLTKIGGRLMGRVLSSGSRVFNLTSPETFAPVDWQTAINRGFSGNTSVYSIIMKDAKKFGSIPLYVYDKRRKEEKALTILEESELTKLINRPNSSESQDVFLTRVRAYFKTCGEAFIWLNRGDLEPYRNSDGTLDDMAIDRLPVLEMQVLPSNFITLIPDPMDLWGVLGYVLEVGERVVIRKNDVVHWKNINLEFDASSRTHLRGISPLTPGGKTLEENNSLTLSAMRSAQNDGVKAVMYNETMNAMTPTQQADMKRVVDAKINNNQVADAVATIQGKWGLLDLSMSSKEQQRLELKQMSWQELCFLLDVPVEFFNPDITFANKEQALIGWITNDIHPACKQFCGELNRVLIKAFSLDNTAFIACDITELPEVRKSMVESAKMMQEIWSISPDDVRDYLGFDRVGGDFGEPWVPPGRTPLSKSNIDDGMGEEDAVVQAYGKKAGVTLFELEGNKLFSPNGKH